MEGTLWGAGRLCRRGRSARRLLFRKRRDEGRGLTQAKGAVQSKKLRARRAPLPQDVGRSTPFFAHHRGPQAAYIKQPASGHPEDERMCGIGGM